MDKPNSSWLKTFSIGFSIISFGITLAIIGYIVLTTKQSRTPVQYSVQTTPIPSPTPFVIPTTDPSITANWKTYINSDYRFTFKYPVNWDYQAQLSTAGIMKDGTKRTNVYFGEPQTKDEAGQTIPPTVPPYVVLSIVTYKNAITNDLKNYTVLFNNRDAEWSTINLNGISAQKVIHILCQGGPCEDVLIKKDNTIIDLADEVEGAYLNQILSTFQFLK